MLQLYDLNKIKIKGLRLYKDMNIESVLSSGDKTLSFLYPSRLSKDIKEECYIRTKKDEFVVKEISTNGEWNSIKATLNVENLEGQAWEHFDTTEKTISECLTLAVAGTGWTVQVNGVNKKRTIRKTNCSTWDIIQQAKKTYLVEIEFDTLNKRINIAQKLGNDKGVYFMDSLNLRNLDVQSNSYDFFTRIIAIGKDDLKVTVENYQYSSKKKTFIWKDERYTDINSLTEDATKKLEEISKPYKAYGADIIDLANTSSKYSILSYGLGDTITLISKDKGIKEKQRIVKITEYPEEPHRNSCEIANSILSFTDIQKEYNDTVDTVSNITTDNGTVDGSTVNSITTKQISDFEASVGKITDLTVVNARIDNLYAEKADVGSLNAVLIRVGDLEATKANVEELTAINASIVNLQANKANITDLTASVGRIEILESSVGDIQTLVNGNLTSNNIQSLILSSDKVTVVNGFIKNAMIENLDVSKINAGDISTNKFRIKSDNGGIEIVGATQQFKDKNNRVRIQMGQDALGNFNFILRGEDGTTTLIDHTGIKENAIADDLIKGNMISENAVGGKQIDYNSFTEEFNKDTNTHTLKSSKVLLDKNNQTLDIAFNTLSTTVDGIEVGGRNYVKKLGGDTYDLNSIYSTDRTNSSFEVINNKKCLKFLGSTQLRINSIVIQPNITYTWSFNVYTTGTGTTINCVEWDGTSYGGKAYNISTTPTKISHTFTSKSTSIYEILHITGLVSTNPYYFSDFKLEKGNKPTDWTPAPEDIDASIQGVKTITESNTTALNIQQGKISALISNTTIVKDGQTIQLKDSYNSTVATVNSISNVISSHTSTIDALTGKITGVETKTNEVRRDLDGTTATVTAHTASINGLNSTVATQSSSITQLSNQISLKVDGTQVTNIVNGEIDKIEVGGRNLIRNSKINRTSNLYSFETRTLTMDLVEGVEYTFSVNGRCDQQALDDGKKLSAYIYEPNWQYPSKVINIYSLTDTTEKISFVSAWSGQARVGFYLHPSGGSRLGTVTVNWAKLEQGNKPTDWTPAPEDIDDSITAVGDRVTIVSNKAASIETTLNGITSRVSNVETTTNTINGDLKSLTTRMTNAEQKITDSSIISTVSNTVYDLAKAMGDGVMLYPDASFTTGTNGMTKYNNSGGIDVVLNRILKPTDCPTTSTHCIEIKVIGTNTSPGLGGFYFGNTARPNAIFILKMTAKIPVGSKLMFASNAYGTGGSAKWLTSNEGTGKWQEYIHKVTCGSEGTFSTTNYFYIDKGDIPFMWRIASATIYDITDTADLNMRINSAEQKITDNAIVSTVRSSTYYKNDLTGKVSSNAIISCINQTAEAIKISASKINLTGYVTMMNLSTAGQTIIDGGNIKTNTISLERLKSATNNPIIRLFGNCSLDATANMEQGIGTAVRLKWDNENYMLISTISTDLYQGGSARYRFYPNYLDCKPTTIYLADQCRIDASSGTLRMYISKTGDTGIRISPNGTVVFLVDGIAKHTFNPSGTKAGGTIVVDGANLGMSPIDSPKILLEDVLFNVDVQEQGTEVLLDSTFLKTISTYAVFCSNPRVTIVSKDRTSFYVQGYTGKVDFRVIGYRIGYEEQYYQVVG
ncbi:phage tail spike protein [Clostridium sp. UBA4395]|uniref:phage tail spike protein n=1 Tax=Clostridium sp. UBA4395 TaxID=1946360 RepID=UPI00321659E9